MAMTLRPTAEQEAEIDKVAQATGSATKSQAVTAAVMNHIALTDEVKRKKLVIAEQRRELERLGNVVRQYQLAHSKMMECRL